MTTEIQVDFLINKIKPILAGQQPDLQGAVIAELLAIYIAGHPRGRRIRAEVFSAWLDMARGLVALYDKQNFPKKIPKKN